jgi:hypothetical protein
MTKEKFAWLRMGIPLAWLAKLDEIPAPNGLADALGDRYLYCHNPVFASIRNAAVRFGYRFSPEDTPLWRDYQSLSLMSLDRILAEKVIPYVDTGRTFQRLVDLHPHARLPPNMLHNSVKRNFVFHESAHCIAHTIMECAAAGFRSFVLESVLAEAFANTVELLGSAFHHLPLSDMVFYALNSYHSVQQERSDALTGALTSMDARLRFTVLFFSYFEVNLATEPPPDSTFQRIAEAAECNPVQARPLSQMAFHLNSGFRESTTPAYFELLGYSSDYKALMTEQWLASKENQQFARELARLLWDAAGNF